MATPPHPNLDFFSILSSTKKITKKINKSDSRHFQLLSLLFILPFSLLLIAFPLLQNLLLPLKPIIFFILYSLTLLTLYLCATSTITYGFFGRRVEFLHSIKSMFNSLFKLFLTFFCVVIVILLSLICIGFIVFSVIRTIQFLGFVIEIQKIVNSSIFVCVIGIIGSLGLLYLCVNWVLAPVIVVVESSWGLEPLRRSAYLVKGMRGVVICLMLYFGSLIWFAMFGNWYDTSPGSGMSVLKIVCASVLLMFFLLNSLTANMILYMNCKALHGELAAEIVEEFDWEYVTLPFGEEKVPHLVSIV